MSLSARTKSYLKRARLKFYPITTTKVSRKINTNYYSQKRSNKKKETLKTRYFG